MKKSSFTLPHSHCGSRGKYHNQRCYVDGEKFDSQKEAERYFSLKLLEKAGQIRNLRRQVKYEIAINGVKICSYIADCVYDDLRTGLTIVEDVKSLPTMTKDYRLKKKLMKAVHGIDISEVL